MGAENMTGQKSEGWMSWHSPVSRLRYSYSGNCTATCVIPSRLGSSPLKNALGPSVR